MPRPGRLILLIITLVISRNPAWGAEITKLEVRRDGTQYEVSVILRVQAQDVFSIFTDYNRWTQLSPLVTESTLLSSQDDHHYRVRSVTQLCFLFLCRDIKQIHNITEIERHEILLYTEPDAESFRYAAVRWRIEELPRYTVITLDARISPAFWVPPVLGPWLLERHVYRLTMDFATSMERLAPLRSRSNERIEDN